MDRRAAASPAHRAGRTAGGGLLAALGLAAALPAQRPGGVHVREWVGELGFEAERRDERNSTAGGERIRQREILFRESLGLRAHGDVYHPALLDFDLGVRTDFDQRDVTTDPGGTEQSSDSTRLFYDAMAMILKEKPLSGDVYARRGRLDTRQRFFATTTAETSTEGADLRWRDLWIPSALHYEHTEYVGHGRDTLRQDDTRWKLDGARNDERTNLSYSLEQNDLDQATFGTHRDEQLARVHFGHRFGQQGAHSVTLGANHRDQSGTQSSLFQQANAGLHVQWLPELQSDHSVAVDHSEVDTETGTASARDGLIASSFLRHRLYESLQTGIGGRLLRNDYETGRLERRDGEFELDYQKTTPFGSIGLGYRPTIFREDEQGGSATVPVVDEPHTFTPGVPILLQSSSVVESSVAVRDATAGTIYVQPSDYLLVATGQRLRIDVPVGSRIVAGTALLVDYVYLPNPGRSYDGVSQAVALTLSFGDFASLAYEHSTDRVELRSGFDDGNVGNSQRDAVRGWLGAHGQSLTVEYEDFDSFISSTERVRALAMSQWNPTTDTTLANTASWYRTRFKQQDGEESGISLVSNLQWRVSAPCTTYLRAEYHRVDYRSDSGTGWQLEAGFDFQVNRNNLSMELRHAVEDFEIASDQELLFLWLSFRRFF